ncbi:hypothetical protein MAM1_0016d01485 [Mucor ambiguus]|uniref:Uncharacterized protein n=1 Tax=Mucor ambiguus TaxID=91626 RepID=A0A0C9M142_9FUNG|nr:hypothetical protein MAM1_0016d01485 [Mucor ambiguus]
MEIEGGNLFMAKRPRTLPLMQDRVTVLEDQIFQTQYRNFDEICQDNTKKLNKEQTDAFVDEMCERLVETINVLSNGSYIFITLVKSYLRNPVIDGFANSAITVGIPNNLLF